MTDEKLLELDEKKAELEKTCLYRQLTNPARTSMPV